MSLRLTIKALRPGGEPPLEFAVDIESAATVEELKQRIAGRVELPQDRAWPAWGGSGSGGRNRGCSTQGAGCGFFQT